MIRTTCNCALCPLSGRTKIHAARPSTGAKLMLVGEAPGGDEEQLGQPFVGATGRLLNWAIKEAGLFRPNLWVTNVITCRPPSNDIDGLEGKDAILCCRPGFQEEMDTAARSGVTTVVALGAQAARAFGIDGGLAHVRGSVYEYRTLSGKKLMVVPTYHPASIMRQHWKRTGGGTADNAVLWLADFRKAGGIAANGWKTLRELFNVTPNKADVLDFVETAIRTNALVAVDTETTGLNPDFAKIVVIGFATGPEVGMSVPILDRHGLPYWGESDWAEVKAAVNRLFATCDQMYQNCFFDVPMLRRNGFDVPSGKVLHDTLAIHHTIAAEAKHDLGTIVSLYGSTSYWKAEFLNRTTTILEMDQKAMRTYNLRDVVVLHQVLPVMLDELKKLNLVDFYKAEVQPLVGCILEMTEEGVGFSPSALVSFKKRLTAMVASLEGQLRDAYQFPDSFNLDSDEHLRWFLYGVRPKAFDQLTELPKKRPGTKVYQQLADLKEIADKVTQPYVVKGWTPPKTDSGKFAVDKQALLALQIQLNNRRAEIADKPRFADELVRIENLLSWLAMLSEHTRLAKLVTTYTKYMPAKDGRIRPRWLLHGTVSGRLSARDPNVQNVPKARDNPDDPAARVREFFVARPGWKMVSCDYVNLEAQLLAYETLDPQLCAVFEKGLNLHDLNTKSMFKIDETSPRWKSARRAAKIFFFGGISYGGGDRTIFEKVWLEAPELNLTFGEFKAAKDSWMADHPSYVQWKAQIAADVMVKRELRTEFGRYRQFLSNDLDIVKEALDFKIQSSGASLVNRAMIRIQRERDRRKLKARFIMQIHDQLVMECPDEEVDTVRDLMVAEMQKPFTYKDKQRSIPVEASVGATFGDL